MKENFSKKINYLTLSTKADIPFEELGIVFRQPSIKEIGMMGGDAQFLMACQTLTRDYKKIPGENLSDNITNFDIFMSIINKRKDDTNVNQIFNAVNSLLFLICPKYEISFQESCIIFLEQAEEGVIPHILDARTFNLLREILIQMFCLGLLQADGVNGDFNPSGIRAEAIAEKLRARHEFLNKRKAERGEDVETKSMFSLYQSILSVGLEKDMNMLAEYSVPQLMMEFDRYMKKNNFDYTFQAKMAGAKNVKDADSWLEEIPLSGKK